MNDDAALLRGYVVRLVNSGAALGTVAALVIGGLLLWGYRTNTRLEAEITRVRGDGLVMAGLQRDNRRLARLVAEADELRREVAELPALRAAVLPSGAPLPVGSVALTIAREGTFTWEREDIDPAELIQRLRDFRARYPAPESSLFVQASGAPVSAVLYVLDEIRKAQIRQVHVDGEPAPDGGPGTWF